MKADRSAEGRRTDALAGSSLRRAGPSTTAAGAAFAQDDGSDTYTPQRPRILGLRRAGDHARKVLLYNSISVSEEIEHAETRNSYFLANIGDSRHIDFSGSMFASYHRMAANNSSAITKGSPPDLPFFVSTRRGKRVIRRITSVSISGLNGTIISECAFIHAYASSSFLSISLTTSSEASSKPLLIAPSSPRQIVGNTSMG